jgi:hypothetical protein
MKTGSGIKIESNSGLNNSKSKTDSGIKIESNSGLNNSKIKTDSGIKIESNSGLSNSKIKTDSGIKTESNSGLINSKIKTDSGIKTESNSGLSNSKIKTDSGIKIESNSGLNNSKSKRGNSAGRNSSVNRMPTSVHVQTKSNMDGKAHRGTRGSSIAHIPGIPSTALGRNAAAIAATASLTTGSAATLVRIMRSESTAAR